MGVATGKKLLQGGQLTLEMGGEWEHGLGSLQRLRVCEFECVSGNVCMAVRACV